MIHSKSTYPRIFPWNRNVTPTQIDRVQDLGGDFTANIEKLYEIGRDGKLGTKKGTPSFAYSMTQFEYGSMAFWRQIAGMEDPASDSLDNSVDLDDLKTSKFDITAYLTDDDTTFRGTIWFPKLRTNGFSINVGDPDATAMRSFDLVGEDYKILDAKYFSFEQETALADAPLEVTLDPVPILWAASSYILRVLRVRDEEVSEITEDVGAGINTWAYNNVTKVVTVQTCEINDIVKVYYPSDTAYTTLWNDNNETDALEANSVKVELQVGVGAAARVYRIQSVNIDVAFDRADYKEIGNREVVQTGVKSKTTTITLGRSLEDFTIEEILRGTSIYPYIDLRNLSEEITLRVKIYEDYTMDGNFKIGYKVTGLSTTTLATADAVEDYATQDNSLESDNLMVSDDESEIDA